MISTLLLTSVALAHKPSLGGDWTGPDNAFEIDDPEISIVVYREITCEQPELWLTFDAVAGEEVWVQLGVPVIDRLEADRPSLAVLGPGLPELGPEEVPFPVPSGVGGIVLDAGAEPSIFDEPFTGTTSWIHVEEWVEMPADGQAWVVGWNPENRTGKLWLAVGVVEDFSDVDWAEAADWPEQVNNFHETGEFEPVPEVEEQVCETEPAGEDGVELQQKGCQTAPATPSLGWLLLAGLGLVRRRR